MKGELGPVEASSGPLLRGPQMGADVSGETVREAIANLNLTMLKNGDSATAGEGRSGQRQV